jgi:hypothetical protein
MSSRVPIRATFEDGSSWEVTIDQRDMAKFELQTFFDPNRNLTRQRYAVYSAAVRGKLTDLSWPKFDAILVDTEAAEEDVEEVVPTQPDPSGGA